MIICEQCEAEFKIKYDNIQPLDESVKAHARKNLHIKNSIT